MRRVYFAHPISQYGTPLEARIIGELSVNGIEVVNPSSDEIKTDFEAYKAANPDNYMQFFKDLCNTCNAIAFTTFEDSWSAESVPSVGRRVGAGVWLEVNTFFERGLPVFYVNVNADGDFTLRQIDDWDGFTCLTVDQTRALLRATGRYNK